MIAIAMLDTRDENPVLDWPEVDHVVADRETTILASGELGPALAHFGVCRKQSAGLFDRVQEPRSGLQAAALRPSRPVFVVPGCS